MTLPSTSLDLNIPDNNEYKITLDEARSLLKYLEREYIPRDPYEDYENIRRVINGLTVFVDSQK